MVDGDGDEDVVRDGDRCLLVDQREVVGRRRDVCAAWDADRGEEITMGVGADRVRPLLPRRVRHRRPFAGERAQRTTPRGEHRVLFRRAGEGEPVAVDAQH